MSSSLQLPFGISPKASYQQRTAAPEELYTSLLTAGNSSDLDKAQMVLGSRHIFNANQWLNSFKKAATNTAKAALRNVVQIGTINAVLSARYRGPGGEVKLSKIALRSACAETKVYEIQALMSLSAGPTAATTENLPLFKPATLSSRIRASALSNNSPSEPGPKAIVVEGDTLNVALQLRRIFKHTPASVIAINGNVPGGFYRRGGATPEEEICRRTNLWDCLDDPYYHSTLSDNFARPTTANSSMGSGMSVNRDKSGSSATISSSTINKDKSGSIATISSSTRDSLDYLASKSRSASLSEPYRSAFGVPVHSTVARQRQRRGWAYPINTDLQCVYAPGVQVFRSGEIDGYQFLKTPGKVSFICVVANFNNSKEVTVPSSSSEALPKLKNASGTIIGSDTSLATRTQSIGLSQSPISSLANINDGFSKKDPQRMSIKMAKLYAKKVEFILKVAIQEGRRVLILGALGCGAHATPPKHAAEIFKTTIVTVDPKGEFFDLIAFAILEDQNSFKAHNPEGNLQPFADILTNGIVTTFSELEGTPEVTDNSENAGRGKKDSVYGRDAAAISNLVRSASNSNSSLASATDRGRANGKNAAPRSTVSFSNLRGDAAEPRLSRNKGNSSVGSLRSILLTSSDTWRTSQGTTSDSLTKISQRETSSILTLN